MTSRATRKRGGRSGRLRIDFMATEGPPMAMEYMIADGFGFGGVNASALFRSWTDQIDRTTGAARG